MAKTLVLYYSKYGTTKRYAEWIASELDGDICSIRDVKQKNWGNYDVVVIGSALYAGTIKGMDIILKNHETLRGKKLVLFTCGLADYSKAENRNEIAGRIELAIPDNIRQEVKTYFLRGGIDHKKLSWIHRMMMVFAKHMLVKNKGGDMSEMDRDFLETYGKTVDFTDRNSITEIVEYCKNGGL